MKITDTNTNQTSVTMIASQTHLTLKKTIIWIALQLFFVIGLQAAWIEKLPTVVKDPDGMELKIFSTGDEYFSFLHDENDYTIVQGNDGYYYYAIKQGENIIASNYKVRNTKPFQTNLQTGIRISPEEYKSRRDAFWKDAPENTSKSVHEGTMVNLVVYIKFADDTEYVLPRSTYDARFNGSDQQSIKDYFQEVSYSNLTIQSYHYPESEMSVNISYQDQYTRDYYRPYNETTNPIGYQGGNSGSQRIDREHTLLQNAVNAISSAIPSNLVIDANNDGKVDNVCFIIRGNAEGWADLLWAHRWVLYSKTVNINGKRVYDYTFQPENQATVKTLAHEMFHTLGAPDLYHYSYDGLNPAGDWDLMQSGFGHMGAYMKWKYAGQKWVTSIPVISAPGTYTLNPISSSSQNAFRINSPNSSTEYFVVEYRKKEGRYETNIPGSGLLVYRINTSAGNGNAQGPPDEVYIYRPNGTTTVNGTLSSAHFNASLSRTAINDQTNPSSFLTEGGAGGLDISNVTVAGETISFDLNGGSSTSVANPQSFTANASGTSQINLAWQKNAASDNVVVAFNTSNTFGTPTGSYSAGNTITGGGTVLHSGNLTSFQHTGLNASTTYYYKIWSVNSTNYSTGLTASASTQSNQFTISLSANPSAGGTVSGAGTYNQGTQATVIATANTGYTFVNWKEGTSIVSTNASYSFAVNSNRSLVANFSPIQYTITATSNPTAGGTITGAGNYNHGSQVSLTATANTGYTFVNWKEGSTVVSTNANYSFTATANRTLTANFSQQQYTISTSANPTQGGSTTGAGSYNHGSQVSLTATANSGYSFVNWKEGNTVVSTNANYSFTATSNRTLTANFSQQQYTIAASANPVEGGSTTGAGSFNHGSQVSLTATANSGYNFVNWKEGSTVVSTNANYSFTATANRTLTANFSQQQYTIAASANPVEGGSTTGAGSYNHGSQVSLTATANSGYSFVNWKEGNTVVSTNANYSFTATANRTLSANFSQQQYTIAASANPVEGGSTTGAGSYNHGAQVSLTASANTGWNFISWLEDGTVVSTSPVYEFLITESRSLTASFSQSQFGINLTAEPAEGGSLSGGGAYNYGQTATVVAQPNSGWEFNAWLENGIVVSQDNEYSFEVTGNRSLSASFTQSMFQLSLQASPEEGGSVSGDGSFAKNSMVSVMASPNNGWVFLYWTEEGIILSNSPEYEFMLSSDKLLVAHFAPVQVNINVNIEESQAGFVYGGGVYNYGDNVILEAAPVNGYSFAFWKENGQAVSYDATYQFTAQQNRDLIAVFQVTSNVYYVMNISSIGNGYTNPPSSQYTHTAGSVLMLEAYPVEGWVFESWDVNGTTFKSQNLQINVGENLNIVAIFALSTSTPDVEESQEINVFPNPAQSVLNISLNNYNGHTSIEIINLQGQTLQTLSNAYQGAGESISFDVNDLKPGIYIIRIINQGKITARKFTKS